MNYGDLLFDIIAAGIFLYFSIRTGFIFFKRRTKYNLALFVITILILTGTILGHFYPGRLNFIRGTGVQILVVAIFTIFLMLFLFYPEIKRFLYRRKMKG